MVVTSRTRNAVVRKGTWVRIPHSPLSKNPVTMRASGFFFFGLLPKSSGFRLSFPYLTAFSKEIVVDISIGKELAALYEGFQNAEIDFLIRPFALLKKGSVFILFGEDIIMNTRFCGETTGSHMFFCSLFRKRKFGFLTGICRMITNRKRRDTPSTFSMMGEAERLRMHFRKTSIYSLELYIQ